MSIPKTIASKTSALTSALLTAAGEFRDGITGLRTQFAEAQRRAEFARTAPVPKDELTARTRAYLTARADDSRKRAATTLVQTLGRVTPVTPPSEFDVDLLRALLLGPALAALPAFVEGLQYEAGAPSHQREAQIQGLEAEVSEIGQQEEQLIDQAIASGVVIEHRPEVRERRATEKRRAELAAAAEAERRQRVPQNFDRRAAGSSR